jgi:hypothetical protein
MFTPEMLSCMDDVEKREKERGVEVMMKKK